MTVSITFQVPSELAHRLRPSPRLQARASALLARSKQGELSRQEEAELERYLVLEHLVRLAKVHAAQRLEQV